MKELKDTNLYIENYDRYVQVTKKMEELTREINLKETRWLEVMQIKEDLNKQNEKIIILIF